MILDFYNIEDLIFNNVDLRKLLIKYDDIFNNWVNFKIFGNTTKINHLKINFLNILNEDDLFKISDYYKEKVSIKKISNNIVGNFSYDLDNFNLNIESYKNFCIFRNNKKVFLTCWR